MAKGFDVDAVRQQFPALQQTQIYFDNAGGSQTLKSVIDSITRYLSSTNVQLGASYSIGQASTKLFNDGVSAVAKYINASPEEVVLGPSTTQLFRNLSIALFEYIQPGDEIIVSKLDHEANIASWVQLAKDRNAKLKWYEPTDKKNPQLDPEVIRSLLSDRTKLVAVTHTSNILGTINDIKAIAKEVHRIPGALLCVDAVAYAPHRAIDVKDLGVDFYSFSWYKCYAAHIAQLYVSKDAQKHLRTLGHFFKTTDTLENLLGLAAANYELTASIPSVISYLESLSWDVIADYEEKLQAILIDYLNSKPDVYQIYGEPVGALLGSQAEHCPTTDKMKRVPVISWKVKGRSSREIVEAIDKKSEYGCRYGAFYSNRLVEEVLGLDPDDGVVRLSALHYNTEDEVRGFVKILDGVVSA